MKVIETSLPGVVVIAPHVHRDHRGSFVELFQRERYLPYGVAPNFQDNLSRSVRGTLRGMHYQSPHEQGKLVQVLSGAIFDVVVDVREGSPTFGQWEGFELSGDELRQLWIPCGFAHGYCVTSEHADVLYKTSEPYAPQAEHTFRWDDPDLAIPWPVESPLLSAKDANAPRLRDVARLPGYDAGARRG